MRSAIGAPALAALLLLLLLQDWACGIQVLESLKKLGDFDPDVSGAKLEAPAAAAAAAEIKDLTVCTRFNLKMLGGYEGKVNLWYVADHRNETKV